MPKVTEAHLEARRSQILDAAWTCFARKGYHQATMQDICQESGLSPGAIYRYFESKEAGQLRPEVDPESLSAIFICAWEGMRHYGLIDPDVFRPERLVEVARAFATEDAAEQLEKYGREPSGEPLLPPLGTPFGRRSRKGGD